MPDAPDWGDRAADLGDATDDVLDDFDVDRRPPMRCRKRPRDA